MLTASIVDDASVLLAPPAGLPLALRQKNVRKTLDDMERLFVENEPVLSGTTWLFILLLAKKHPFFGCLGRLRIFSDNIIIDNGGYFAEGREWVRNRIGSTENLLCFRIEYQVMRATRPGSWIAVVKPNQNFLSTMSCSIMQHTSM